ncbi:MAG TPA: glucose-6-phosphate dehydrogenase [Candidatus Methylacidiphilales bacterium]|nr:glucose-6-phosphate dehydrogenase [Candidatus Methylacidiphilales bacterium]
MSDIPLQAGPCAIVIFGASGDLTKRKLLPSLYNLAAIGILPEDFSIIGVARRETSHDDFRRQMTEAISEFGTQKIDPALWRRFEERMYYCQGSFDDPATFDRLKDLLDLSEKKHGTGGNALFYLSVQPVYFGQIPAHLKAKGLVEERDGRWRRVIIEKPFGHDLASSRQLNREICASLNETQIFRIDHYLGKETAQNILIFRMGNGMLEPIWNRRYIDHIQITVAESIGVEGRGAFYETAGAFRDVMQNHMFMLLALVAMEPPNSLSGEAVRNEKVKLLEAMRLLSPEAVARDTVRGQYGPGIAKGEPAPGYRQEPKVDPNSTVETFAAMKLWVDNWRWAGVPFYLRSGKRLPKRSTEIVVRLKNAPLDIFGENESDPVGPNRLIIHIQPREGISLQVRAKIPGPTIRTRGVKMDFNYDQFGKIAPTTGYEKLLYDCMVGDSTLFHRTDMVEAAWKVAQPILDGWQEHPPTDFPNYASGDWGPPAAQELISRDNHTWWMEPKEPS